MKIVKGSVKVGTYKSSAKPSTINRQSSSPTTPSKTSAFKVGQVPKTSIKLGRIPASSFKKGNQPVSSFSSSDTLKAVIPVRKPVSTDTLTRIPTLNAKMSTGIGSANKIPTKTINFKQDSGPTNKIKPTVTKPPAATQPKIPVRPSGGSSSSGGSGKVVSIPLDKANSYFKANPGARAKDYTGK